MAKQPIILEFCTDSGNEYVYDGITNRVFFTPEPLRHIIRSYRDKNRADIVSDLSDRYGTDVVEDLYDQVERWVDGEGAFFLGDATPEEPPSGELDRQKRDDWRSPHLVLSLTSDCNLACKYCVTTGSVWPRQSMTYEIATAGIDRFFEFSADPCRKALDRVCVSFFGGEPFLQFGLMQKCVEYAQRKWKSVCTLLFTATTNGTLLTDRIGDYCAANDIRLHVSLDGPVHEHDRNRVTRKGHGTFAIIRRNLRRLRERHPAYYSANTKVLCTYDCGTDVESIIEWFYENKSTLPRLLRVSRATEYEHTCDRFGFDARMQSEARQDQMRATFKESILRDPSHAKELMTKWALVLGIEGYWMADRDHVLPTPRIHCWPGVSRISLHPDGAFHICERLTSYKSIGDVQGGIDAEKVRCIIQEYLQWVARKGCRSCIAQYVCQGCYANTLDAGKLDYPCDGLRQQLQKKLEYWYSIFERCPDLVNADPDRGKETILNNTL